MRLYLSAKTNTPDLMVDFIEVKLKSGEEVSLNWDESEISRREDGFDARYKGVYFGEDYANGRIDELQDMEISYIQLYSDLNEKVQFEIEEMEFEDEEKSLVFTKPDLSKCGGLDRQPDTLDEQIKSAADRAGNHQDAARTKAKENAPESLQKGR